MTTHVTGNSLSVKAGDIRAFGAMPVPKVTPELLTVIRTGEV